MGHAPPLTPAEFAALVPVSRETLDRLSAYEALLRRWQRSINLVGRMSLNDVWRRHFLDSAQLCPLLGPGASFVDFGSGAGFPGLIVSILSGCSGVLIEADRRKAAFLREAARVTGANVEVRAERIEQSLAVPVDFVVARALAPLVDLLTYAEPWCRTGTECFFLKGAAIDEELTDAVKIWKIKYEKLASRSDPSGAILHITEFSHV